MKTKTWNLQKLDSPNNISKSILHWNEWTVGHQIPKKSQILNSLGQTGSHDMGMDLGFPHKRSSRLPRIQYSYQD